MPKFSPRSRDQLDTCAHPLQTLFDIVIGYYDCTILEGFRDEATQQEMFRTGRSKLEWPESKHNATPSQAVDVAPSPIDWTDLRRFYHFAGFVKGIATSLGISIRCGADWDNDNDLGDQTFMDLVHYEIMEDKT